MQKPAIVQKFKKKFSIKHIMFFWYRHYTFMFFMGFLLVFAYCAYIWHFNLVNYKWDDEKKKQFLEQNFKETAFKEGKFTELVLRLKQRATLHTEKPVLTQDIFEGKKLQGKKEEIKTEGGATTTAKKTTPLPKETSSEDSATQTGTLQSQ